MQVERKGKMGRCSLIRSRVLHVTSFSFKETDIMYRWYDLPTLGGLSPIFEHLTSKHE